MLGRLFGVGSPGPGAQDKGSDVGRKERKFKDVTVRWLQLQATGVLS